MTFHLHGEIHLECKASVHSKSSIRTVEGTRLRESGQCFQDSLSQSKIKEGRERKREKRHLDFVCRLSSFAATCLLLHLVSFQCWPSIWNRLYIWSSNTESKVGVAAISWVLTVSNFPAFLLTDVSSFGPSLLHSGSTNKLG